MININDYDKKEMLKKEKGYFIRDGIKYYYKLAKPTLEGTELVCEELASLVDIKCAHYEKVMLDGLYFYISKDIGYPNKFITAKEYGLKGLNLYEIWDLLEKKKIYNSKEILDKIIKIYLFDILIVNPDRRYANWGFIIDDSNNILDVCIIDNELAFNFSKMYLSSDIIDHNKIDIIDKQYKEGIDELSNFINTSSNEYLDMVIDMLNKINPDIVSNLLSKYISDEEDRTDMLDVFIENYNLIDELIKERKM